MELDNGADVTLISEKVWEEQLSAIPLRNTEVRLRTYTGEPLKMKGEVQVTVAHNGQVAQSFKARVPRCSERIGSENFS